MSVFQSLFHFTADASITNATGGRRREINTFELEPANPALKPVTAPTATSPLYL